MTQNAKQKGMLISIKPIPLADLESLRTRRRNLLQKLRGGGGGYDVELKTVLFVESVYPER